MKRLPVVSEIWPWLIALLAVSFILVFWLPIGSMVCLALVLFLGFFFRDPERRIQIPPGAICSPADGRVLEVSESDESTFLGQPAWKVGIFLSLLDVHLNRSPTAGRVAWIRYEKGKFRPAFVSSTPTENERNLIGIEGDRGKVLVVQIAGILARRIECWLKVNDTVGQGQRIGMIRFGSRTELFLPKASTEVLVHVGTHVKAGETILGRWTN